ncbi:MAG: UvrD-helicase domain-containing protein [Thermoguttaceae bacterium]
MKAEEIALIQSKHNAAIVAPAGHGKTEMIAELVDKLPNKKLVLTHTNAGVSALIQRFNKKNISREKYNLSTISSFCMKWCEAYPKTGEIDSTIGFTDKRFYSIQYKGASRIFTHQWARDILFKTYSCVIIDEYQDCINEQHQIFTEINNSVPVYVLGDPLQSIFGWAGELVSWNNLGFERVYVETAPYRWKQTCIELGEYLALVRDKLKPALNGETVYLSTVPNGTFLKRISPENVLDSTLLQETNQYQSALYITKWPTEQCLFSRQTGGVFQNDEPQSLNTLYEFAKSLDTEDGYSRANKIYDFIEETATQVHSELGSYKNHIKNGDFNFSRIKKHTDFGNRMKQLYLNHGYNDMLNVLQWIKSNSLFRLYRWELYTELMRAIRYARDNGGSIYNASQQIRMNPNNQSRYTGFRKLSSRAVLSKGLEFECVIIDLNKRYTATEMYVAMTRATKVIYFITDQDSILLNKPEGL